MKDWFVRILLRTFLAGSRERLQDAWAVSQQLSTFEEELWRTRNVKVYSMDLRKFTEALRISSGSLG